MGRGINNPQVDCHKTVVYLGEKGKTEEVLRVGTAILSRWPGNGLQNIVLYRAEVLEEARVLAMWVFGRRSIPG